MKLFPLLITIGLVTNINAQSNLKTNSTLAIKERSIVPIAAFATKGDMQQLQLALNSGLNTGLTVNEIKETLVHIYAYAGFPRSLNALKSLRTVLDERKQKGINDPEGKAPTPLPTSDKTKLQVGTDMQTKSMFWN